MRCRSKNSNIYHLLRIIKLTTSMKFGYWHQSTKALTHPYKKDLFIFFGQQISTLSHWQRHGEKNPSENGASLKNGPVHLVTSPLFGFSHVLHRHVRNWCQSPSSPGPLEMERHIGQTARGVDSQPGRRSRRSRRRQWVLAAAERSGRPWHGLLQYGTSPVWTAGKIRQLWSILMKPDNLHAVSRLKRWLKQAKKMPLAAQISRSFPIFRLWCSMCCPFFVRVCAFHQRFAARTDGLLPWLRSRVDELCLSHLFLMNSLAECECAPAACSSLSRKDKEEQLRVMIEANCP